MKENKINNQINNQIADSLALSLFVLTWAVQLTSPKSLMKIASNHLDLYALVCGSNGLLLIELCNCAIYIVYAGPQKDQNGLFPTIGFDP